MSVASSLQSDVLASYTHHSTKTEATLSDLGHNLIRLGTLNQDVGQYWPAARKSVLWGWKRDVADTARVVFFSGRMERFHDEIAGVGNFLFWQSRVHEPQAVVLRSQLMAVAEATEPLGFSPKIQQRRCSRTGLVILNLTMGQASPTARDVLSRLRRRRPRTSWPVQRHPMPLPVETATEILSSPFDLYVGSGLSYEAGIPTLCDVHATFGVDNEDGTDFFVGANDPLLLAMALDAEGRIRRFYAVHWIALSAHPTPAQRTISSLYRRGLITQVLTDNVENHLSKSCVSFQRVRGTGVLNERYPIEMRTKTLVVVGVAADRREIIKQARAQGASIVVVNPQTQVSPKVQHLSYLCEKDRFYRMTAQEFFGSIQEDSP